MDAPSFRLLVNPRHGVPGVVTLNAAGFRRAKAEVGAWDVYAPTPLHALPRVAEACGVGAVHVKDERGRFGLGGFKALAAAYVALVALRAALARDGSAAHATAASLAEGADREAAGRLTLCCEEGGSFARGLAWAAARFGAGFARMPAEEAGRREGCVFVADAASPGYTELPREGMQATRIMVDEVLDQVPGPPSHVFVQARTGGLAAAAAVHLRSRLSPEPALVVVEREARLLSRAETARPGAPATLPAGPGELNLLAWQELDRAAMAFLAAPEAGGVRRLAEHGIAASGSGAAGLDALLLAVASPAARAALRLDGESRVLLFSTGVAV